MSKNGGIVGGGTDNSAVVGNTASQSSQSHQHQQQQHHHEGKEEITPLTRRPIHLRLDVYPFILGYILLILVDAYVSSSVNFNNDTSITNNNGSNDSSANATQRASIIIDILYISLLISQLVLFLKCQWDPLWHARVAYRRYRFRPTLAKSNNATKQGVDNNDELIRRKIDDMLSWTHCLIVPPNPYATINGDGSGSNKGGKSSKKGRGRGASSATSQTVRPERPGVVPLNVAVSTTSTSNKGDVSSFVATILFRGWTYRCCCNLSNDNANNIDGGNEHVDLPMESIWHKEQHVEENGPKLDEISDGEEDSGKDDKDQAEMTAIPTSSSSTWTPNFHRLHFPINLPLQFYASYSGHTHATLQSTRSIYGRNTTIIPLPPYLSLLTQQLIQPMFLFQLLCVMLWCLDEYWMYAIFTLGTLVMFESLQAFNRYKSVKRLREEVVGADVGDEDTSSSSGSGHAKKQMVECYRMEQWTSVPTNELVVGDVISLVSPSIHTKQQQQQMQGRNVTRNVHDHDRGCTVPADLLLLSGRAVVNEAMLTGESVPQVKESIEVGEENNIGNSDKCEVEKLDLSDGSPHKRCVLFGGTTLMDHHSSEEDQEGESSSTSAANANIPTPPNHGLVCFVLRTGFDTIQGSLLRTLAYHAEAGGGSSSGGEGVNAKETFYFLLLLLLCALASAATVVHHAWGDVTRNHFKLVLHVVIIITSVIPPELPMELSLAVTTSLAELVKRYQVYCTEPFRIPLAGLVDTCCFDKTGTLTSDELRLHGVRLPTCDLDETLKTTNDSSSTVEADTDLILFDDILSKDKSDSTEDEMGINSVRSLLPRETLRVMVGCQSLAITHVFVPGRGGRTTVQMELVGDPLEKSVMEGCGFTIHPKTDVVIEKESLASMMNGTAPPAARGSIKILHRFAFSSKLRRMTVLALDTEGDEANSDNLWALTKGAPEALKPMLDPSSLPSDYEQSYLRHMSLGRRVLALAYRNLGKNTPSALAKWKSSRDNVEANLTFAGLLIMDSPLKADSARVIKELRVASNVVMVTGDAVLTAAEVARRVGIVDASQECTYELCHNVKGSSSGGSHFVFRPLDDRIGTNNGNKQEKELAYTPSNYSKLEALVRDGKANFCVTGDVLTKLANHAVEVATMGKRSFAVDDRAVLNHPAAKSALSNLVPIISVFARHAPRHKEAVIAAFNASGKHTLMCGDGTNDVGALKQAHVGVSIISVPDLEAKQRSANDAISAARAEEKKERKAAKKKKGSKSNASSNKKPKRNRAERIERSLQALAEAEDELNFVSLGNASVASPFTSRKTSVRCCKDILQQGRCTLVTMTQIYKILGVQCLVNALVLTTLHQKGVKQGDRQLTAVGLVVAALFLFVTRGKPLPKLSKKKPPASVLCKETLISMTVQFGIHFAAIMAVTFMSDVFVDPYDPSTVPDGAFNPNTLNTATFLITVLSSINAFLVNYRGRPYMESLTENKLLWRSILACYCVLYICALEWFPPLNQLMQLSPLPTTGPPAFNLLEEGKDSSVRSWLLSAIDVTGFRTTLCVIMVLDTAFAALAESSIRLLMERQTKHGRYSINHFNW